MVVIGGGMRVFGRIRWVDGSVWEYNHGGCFDEWSDAGMWSDEWGLPLTLFRRLNCDCEAWEVL